MDKINITEFLKRDEKNMSRKRNNKAAVIGILIWSILIYMVQNTVVRYGAVISIALIVVLLLHMEKNKNISKEVLWIYHGVFISFWYIGCFILTCCMLQELNIFQKYFLLFLLCNSIIIVITFVYTQKKIYKCNDLKKGRNSSNISTAFFIAVVLGMRPLYSFFEREEVFSIIGGFSTLVFGSYSVYCWIKVYGYTLEK